MISLNKIALTVLCVTLFSCKKNDASHKLSGKFINATYLEKSKTGLLADIPFYGVEMTFEKDSVLFSNGFETGKLRYTQSGNEYILKEAYQHNGILKDMIVEATSDSTFILKDNEYTTLTTYSTFTKSKASFEAKLSETLLEGDYEVLFPETLKSTKVTFGANGTTNFPDYNHYSICYSGDCMQLVDDKINVLSLSQNNKSQLYGLKSGANNTLELYSVSAPIPDMKGGQKITGKAFILKKIQK